MGVDKGPFDCLQNLIDDNLCKFRVIEFEIQARGRERLGVTGRGIGAARTSWSNLIGLVQFGFLLTWLVSEMGC